MANLAIKGHPTRGKDVIEILEMLGGVNKHQIGAIRQTYVYFLDIDGIIRLLQISQLRTEQYIVYSLEEFLEKYPYKIGDRVTYIYNHLRETQIITNMRWDSNYDCVLYYLDDYNVIKVEDILYKIGSPEDNIPTIQDKSTVETIKEHIGTFKPSEGTLVQIDFTKELRIADEVEVILGNYEFVLKDGKTYFVKKKPQYPKTYDECCNILGIEDRENGYCGYEYELLGEFQKLYICRNAYWKIAGEEMGLDKPWEPDWNNVSDKHCIYFVSGEIWLTECQTRQCTLAFPTAEMRDAFYENFKELIESCKELL